MFKNHQVFTVSPAFSPSILKFKKSATFRVAVGLHTSSSSDVVDDVSFVQVKQKQQEGQQPQQQRQQVLTKLADCLNAFTQQERVCSFRVSYKTTGVTPPCILDYEVPVS